MFKKFENISNAKAYKTKMTHKFCSSSTVTIRCKYINPEPFINSDAFPKKLKVFQNKNKYKGDSLCDADT